jgi:hypothetical protein
VNQAVGRDQRLDFWRGLCLVDMVFVHLAFERLQFPWPFTDIFGYYTRFAAGGFVFIAGLGVGLIFLPKAVGPWPTRRPVYRRLWRRAGFLLLIHYLTATAFFSLDLWRGFTPWPDTVWRVGAAILTLRFLPHYGDILPLYVLLLAAAPLINEVRLRLGWLPVAAASIVLVGVGQAHPWMLSVHAGENFPPALWQVFFVAGLVFGVQYPAYRRAPLAYKRGLCALSWVAFAVIFLSQYGHTLGIVRAAPLALTFRKVPLSLGEIYWYFTLFLTLLLSSDLLWERRLAGRSWVGFVSRLGRRSLPVYVGHVFGQALVMQVVWRGGVSASTQMLLVGSDLAALWALAWIRDQGWSGARRGCATALGWLTPAFGVGRLAPVAVAAVAVLNLLGSLGSEPAGLRVDLLGPVSVPVPLVTEAASPHGSDLELEAAPWEGRRLACVLDAEAAAGGDFAVTPAELEPAGSEDS